VLTSAWSGLYFADGSKTYWPQLILKSIRKRGLIMTTNHGTANFAIKVGYYVLAAGVVVFVAMLVLTVYP
jgi:hypothetical protein